MDKPFPPPGLVRLVRPLRQGADTVARRLQGPSTEDLEDEVPEETEEEEETGDEPEADAAPEPEQEAPKPKRARRRRIGPPPPRRTEPIWESSEADYLWDEILDAIANGTQPVVKGLTPYDIDIRVYASDDPSRQLGSFNGATVTSTVAAGGGGQMGSQRLRDEVIKRIHAIVTPGGSARYSVHFVRRSNGYKVFARSMLSLPSMDQIIALRHAAGAQGDAAAPYREWSAPPSAPGYPPVGYGQPPPQSSNGEVAQLRADVGRLNGMLEQTLKALAEGKPIPAPAAPPPAPPLPPPPVDVAEQLLGTVKLLKELGIQVGAPPPAPPAPAPVQVVQAPASEGGLVGAASRLSEEASAFGQFLGVMKQMRTYMRQGEAILGVGGAGEVVDVEDPPPAEPEPKKPPFTASETGAKFSNGTPVMYAETPDGKWSPWGTVMSNPIIVEKTMEAVGPVLAAVAAGVGKKMGIQIPGITPEETAPAAPAAPQLHGQVPAASVGAPVPQENGAPTPQRTGWPSM